MNVALTGSSGELGSLLLRRLVADRGVKRIVALDLRPPRVPGAKIQAVLADVRAPDLVRHFTGCDVVVHFAYLVTQLAARDRFWSVNVEGSKNVFRAALAAGARQIVYASSVAAYGVVPGHPVPIVESTPRLPQPDFPYAATKQEVEALLDGLEEAHPALAICRLRPAILVGRQMEHLFGMALRRRLVASSGSMPLSLVWDEDVADAAHQAIRRGARGAFNLAAEEPLSAAELAPRAGMRTVKGSASMRRLAALLLRLLGRFGREVPDPSWLSLDATLVMSSERARQELGWRPRCPTCTDVLRRYADVVPRRLDPRVAGLLGLVAVGSRFVPMPEEARRVSSRIQLELTGAGGGDIAVCVDQGRLRIRRGRLPSPGSLLALRAETFLDLFAGRRDPFEAQLTGKILVEGDPVAMMVLGAMVSQFRTRLGRWTAAWQGARR
jgi:nucleoside-diphosphate-sugar epimerase/putative sterol carrier protein